MVPAIKVFLDLTPHEIIEQIETDLGLTSSDLARALDASVRTIERWRMGQAYPQTEMRHRLAEMICLHRHLLATFTTPEAARTWLRTANRYLGGLNPADVLRAGRLDRVEAALEALDSGIFL